MSADPSQKAALVARQGEIHEPYDAAIAICRQNLAAGERRGDLNQIVPVNALRMTLEALDSLQALVSVLGDGSKPVPAPSGDDLRARLDLAHAATERAEAGHQKAEKELADLRAVAFPEQVMCFNCYSVGPRAGSLFYCRACETTHSVDGDEFRPQVLKAKIAALQAAAGATGDRDIPEDVEGVVSDCNYVGDDMWITLHVTAPEDGEVTRVRAMLGQRAALRRGT